MHSSAPAYLIFILRQYHLLPMGILGFTTSQAHPQYPYGPLVVISCGSIIFILKEAMTFFELVEFGDRTGLAHPGDSSCYEWR